MEDKVLVLDIDGTLTNSRKEISPGTKAGLIDIMDTRSFLRQDALPPACGVMRKNWNWRNTGVI